MSELAILDELSDLCEDLEIEDFNTPYFRRARLANEHELSSQVIVDVAVLKEF